MIQFTQSIKVEFHEHIVGVAIRRHVLCSWLRPCLSVDEYRNIALLWREMDFLVVFYI